jgi:hypothetical protein
MAERSSDSRSPATRQVAERPVCHADGLTIAFVAKRSPGVGTASRLSRRLSGHI